MTKTALITGGSRGIGKATVDLLRAKGWDVIAPTRAELNMGNLESGWWLSIGEDVKFDAVVFCHGEWYSTGWSEQWVGDFSKQYESRVIGPWCLLAKGLWLGRISECVVTVSSTRGFIGGVDTGPYALACAAQIAMMLGYAREYEGVRFNIIAPGLTRTRMGQQVVKTGGAKPGAKMQLPENVAQVIVDTIENPNANGWILKVVARADDENGESAVSRMEWKEV